MIFMLSIILEVFRITRTEIIFIFRNVGFMWMDGAFGWTGVTDNAQMSVIRAQFRMIALSGLSLQSVLSLSQLSGVWPWMVNE